MPVAVSRALPCQCTARLTQLVTLRATLLPGCFEAFAVVVIDGKKIKNASARLKPTRPYSGALLAAKALVANLRNFQAAHWMSVNENKGLLIQAGLGHGGAHSHEEAAWINTLQAYYKVPLLRRCPSVRRMINSLG